TRPTGGISRLRDILTDAEVAALRLRCVDGDNDLELRCLRAGYISALGQITDDEDMMTAAAALACPALASSARATDQRARLHLLHRAFDRVADVAGGVVREDLARLREAEAPSVTACHR
ncbi:MAG: hypothetical protein ACXWD8_19825, partial [Mycobacterium sp.]